MSADQQRQMQELQHQMARLQTEIDETKQREKQNPTSDFINEPLENNVPIDPDNFKEMHAFMFDEPEVYGKWRERQQQLNTDNFNAWRRKFNAHIKKNRMTDHKKFLAESPYREQDLVAAWGWYGCPLKKLPRIASKTDFPQVVFPRDVTNSNLYPGVSQQQIVELYNMFKIQQQKIDKLEKMIYHNNI